MCRLTVLLPAALRQAGSEVHFWELIRGQLTNHGQSRCNRIGEELSTNYPEAGLFLLHSQFVAQPSTERQHAG